MKVFLILTIFTGLSSPGDSSVNTVTARFDNMLACQQAIEAHKANTGWPKKIRIVATCVPSSVDEELALF